MQHKATVHWFRELKGSAGAAIRSLTPGRDGGKTLRDKNARAKIFFVVAVVFFSQAAAPLLKSPFMFHPTQVRHLSL